MYRLLFLMSFHYFCVADDVFTNSVNLGKLIDTENHILENIETVIEKLQLLKSTFERYKTKFVHHENATEEYTLKYVANPLNSFALIKRLTIDLGELNRIHNETFDDINENLFENPDKTYPTHEDMIGISNLLKVLQETYDQNITDFTNGYVNGIKYRDPLNSEELYHLGKAMCADIPVPECTDWLRESLERWNSDEEIFKTEIMATISEIYYYTNNTNASLEWDNKILHEDPDNIDTLIHKARNLLEAKYGRNESDYEEKFGHLKKNYEPEEINKFNSLCSGELQLPETIKSRLHCFYKYGRHPFLRLAPLKMELLYDKPEVYLVHDMNTETERQELIESAKTKLFRSMTLNSNSQSIKNTFRVSSSAGFDFDDTSIKNYVQRNLDLTDLVWRDAIDVQVTHYAPGGFYRPHHDMLATKRANEFFYGGNRVITVLHYLSEVEHGGGTALSDMEIMALPQKGSALYWRNLHSSGEADFRTSHGGCPILYGIKWVSNVWIHQEGQEEATPCGLEYLSEDYNVTAISEYKEMLGSRK